MGVNSFRPHAAANVLHNEYGDCKDKANLFNSLLRSLEIEARLVRVSARLARRMTGCLVWRSTHAISRVALGGQPVWVDTTG